jgi:hypothetical protein
MYSEGVTEESRAFLAIVDKIAGLAKKDWKGRKEGAALGDTALKFRDELQKICFPLEDLKFDNLLHDARTGSVEMDQNFYVYLPPLVRESRYIPILRLELNLPSGMVNLRLELHTYRGEEKLPSGIGVRFECPIATDGAHSYHHAQLFSPNSNSSPVPERFPAFPLPAHDPVTLLLCLVVSLYGREDLARFIDDVEIRGELRERLRITLFRTPAFQPAAPI